MTIEDVVKSIVAFLIMFVPGVLFIIQGIRMLQGEGKAWYFARHIYAGAVYGYIPLGIGSICMALATIPESKALTALLIYIGGFFGILGVVFNFIRPSFMKPVWYRSLESRYGNMMPVLENEAHEMGLELWQSKMETQADIDAWAEEVRQKYIKIRREHRLKEGAAGGNNERRNK
jgi:hypothetical protein